VVAQQLDVAFASGLKQLFPISTGHREHSQG
jgi:hypothetical protein